MIEPVKLLLMFVNETDRWHDAPLYHAIVLRLRQLLRHLVEAVVRLLHRPLRVLRVERHRRGEGRVG